MKKLFLTFSTIALLGLNACKEKDTEPDVLKVYSLSEIVNGKTRNDIEIATSKFQYPLDFSQSPLLDTDGSRSAEKYQPLSDFIILGSNTGGVSERSLTISAKKPVFFNTLITSVWYYENDPCDPDKPPVGQSIKDYLLDFVEPYFLEKNIVNMEATLDGKPIVADLKPYKFTTETFKNKVPTAIAGNYCPDNKNDATFIVTGYSLLVKLPKGKHVLAYKGDILDADGKKENDFHTEIKWNLTVE